MMMKFIKMNMTKYYPFRIQVNAVVFLLMLLLFHIPLWSQDYDYRYRNLDVKRFDANSIRAKVTNYGSLFNLSWGSEEDLGIEWPRGSGINAIYYTGICFAAKVDGEIRATIAEGYDVNYLPGAILSDIYPEDPSYPSFRIHKIEQGIIDSWDYRNWPYKYGAPLDSEGNPLLIGDQTLWCVLSDNNDLYEKYWKSKPLHLEIQQTVFGWTRYSLSEEMLFLRWLIINKGVNQLDSVYFCLWNEPCIGTYGDDKIGCDSTLSLGYFYNETNYDEAYGEAPPSLGFQILQGPLVYSEGDTGIFSGRKIANHRNLMMTSLSVSYGGISGEWTSPRNPLQAWYRMQAKWWNGRQMTYGGYGDNPNNPPTNYLFSGDPESGAGWLEVGACVKCSMLINSGPFQMAPGDSQEVVVAVIIARHGSNLQSVTYLKSIARVLKPYYDNYLYKLLRSYPKNPPWINKFRLFQNYPNPFNHQTTIQYNLPVSGHVKVEIYTVLGQKVAILVDGFQEEADTYELIYDASQLASGVYLYRLQAGKYVETRKMVLMR